MERVASSGSDRISLDYHGRRVAQELRLAERSTDVSVRKAHLELARWHRERSGQLQ